MLVGLVFVLARSVIKMLVERKRALPSRVPAKLVIVLLAMTLILPCWCCWWAASSSSTAWIAGSMRRWTKCSTRPAHRERLLPRRQRQVSDETARLART